MSEATATGAMKSSEESGAGEIDENNPTGTKAPALKDRQCQYCHQAFTSSSLGRHLDQYLFKKKPDGIHDVEEIRRIRSSITRRQARTSSGKRESPEHGSGGSYDHHSALSQGGCNKTRDGGARMLFNTPTWHTTGVINDIPEPGIVSDRSGTSRQLGSQNKSVSISLPDYASRGGNSNASDTARALELALREVLDSIKAAISRTRVTSTPFDFDLQAQTFPALCLQMLPPPPSLFATQPFSSSSTFPLDPPDANQLEIVRHALRARIDQWKSDQRVLAVESRGGSGKTSLNQDSNMINRTAFQHEEMSSRHLELAFQHWTDLPDEVKRDTWQLEITRAFAREAERRKQLEKQLARVQQEANQLRGQVERLGACQWPREFAIFPPDMLPLPRDVVRELDSEGSNISPGSQRWDYDNVVAKWKRVVRHDKSMGRVGVGYTNSVVEDNNTDSRFPRNGDESNSSFNRSTSLHPPAAQSPDPPPGAAGQFSFLNSSQQPSYQSQQDVSHNSIAAPHTKRQRLMNGHPNNLGRQEDEDDQSASTNVNGTSSTWSPNSAQSFIIPTFPASATTTPSSYPGVW